MAQVRANIDKEHYKVNIKTLSGNELIADEPSDNGGQNLGFSPHELLAASLAACTSATLRMYADRKGWDLVSLDVHIEIEEPDEEGKTVIRRHLTMTGDLDEAQKQRLTAIANKCPVHKVLTNPIEIITGDPEAENI